MKKVLLSIVAFTLIFNTISAEESEVLEVNEEATTIVEESINNETEVVNNETTKEIILASGEDVKTYVAQIGETKYETLDEAVKNVQDGEEIILLDNCNLTALLDKNLTFTGNGTITINNYTLNGYKKDLTLKGKNVKLHWTNGEKGNWLMLATSGSIKVLDGATMIMEFNSKTTGTKNALYMNSGSSIVVDNASTFKIIGHETKGITGEGIQLDKTGKSTIKVTNGSTFIIDGTNRGYVNSPVIYVENSTFKVINCTNNGSNGGKFTAINSNVTFENNNVLGLSVHELTVKNSTLNLNNNGYSGLFIGKSENPSLVDGKSKVYINGNNKTAYRYGAFWIGSSIKFEKGAILEVNNNKANGIRVSTVKVGYSGEANGELLIEEGVKVSIQNNEAFYGLDEDNFGGGINATGKVVLPKDAKIYNNHATNGGDDIYVTGKGSIDFGKTGTDWTLNGGKKDKTGESKDCTDKIDGWYDDSKNSRWNAHDKENKHVDEIPANAYEGTLSIKAAHGIYGKLIVRYVDTKGNVLSKELTSTEKVDTEYTTIEKEFEDYSLTDVQGETKGKYIDGTITVTYIYEFTGGTGGEDVPETGINTSNALEITTVLSLITLVTTIILRKRFN
ncbi:MAG: MucBP domain-containing protein [Mollicutes bacterium]|nr:MucBP domain-containing protein [Mollicutes bacterium]